MKMKKESRPAFFVIAILVLAKATSASFTSSVASGASVLFEFDHTECQNQIIKDKKSSGLMGSLTVNGTSHCLSTGNGVVNSAASPANIARVSSSTTMTQWSSMFQSTKRFSMETWLRYVPLSSTDTHIYNILSIDSKAAGASNIFLYQKISSGKNGFVVSVGDASSQTVNLFKALTSTSSNYHLVLTMDLIASTPNTFDDDNQDYWRWYLYLNSTLIYSQRISTYSFNSASSLYLFSEPSGLPRASASAWIGQMYLLAFYNRTLSAAEVLQNFQAKIPNSLPISCNVTASIQENGEVGMHYSNPSYYLSPVPVLELANITLKALDDDEDVSSPNYDATAARLKIYLSSLPSKGTLYYLNGTAISRVPALIPSSANKTIKYRPLWQETSSSQVYTSFRYYAIDGVTGEKGKSATVSIKVQSTHQMPKAINTTLQAQAGRFQVVSLNATVKDAATIRSSYISSLPKHGKLYQVHKTNGSVAQSSPISTIPAKLWSPIVAYIYTGPQNLSLNSVTGQMTIDSFRFKVEDSLGAQSLSSSVNVTVTTSLKAVAASTASASSRALQGMKTSLTIYAYDNQSLTHRHLCFQIMSLPSHGILMQAASAGGEVISVGDLVKKQVTSYPYSKGGSVVYQSTGDYFNSPSTTYNGSALTLGAESFSFRVIDCNATSVVSLSVKQGLTVVNVNNPTTVTFPQASYTVDPTTNQTEAINSPAASSARVIVNGVVVADPDRNVDPVLVSLLCSTGRLVLNAAHLSQATFRQRTNKKLLFTTTPYGLQLLLNGLIYVTSSADDEDQVFLAVYDGVGGDCLTSTAFTTYSNRTSGCLLTKASFTVLSNSYSYISELGYKDKKGHVQPLYLGVAITVVLLLVMASVWCCCRARVKVCAKHCCVCPVLGRGGPLQHSALSDTHNAMGETTNNFSSTIISPLAPPLSPSAVTLPSAPPPIPSAVAADTHVAMDETATLSSFVISPSAPPPPTPDGLAAPTIG